MFEQKYQNMAGTPCGRLICDNSGPRPEYLGPEVDLPDILVFHGPGMLDVKRLQVVPSYFTSDPKKAGKTRHQQAIDIIKDIERIDRPNMPSYYEEFKIGTEVEEFHSAGSVQGGEPKTQSCTVNAREGNTNAGEEGQMVEEQREEFLAVWAAMVETGKDKVLKDVIEKKQRRSMDVHTEKNGISQAWGITVFGIHD